MTELNPASPGTSSAVPLAEYHRSVDALDRAIVSLTRKLAANEYQLLVLIREFDERGGWLKWSFANCAEWLHYRCDLSLSAAREKIRVAHALKPLSEISRAFERGVLTYSKVRALTRVANTANESELLAFALRTTAARVEERCRQMRNVNPESTDVAQRAHSRRCLSQWRDEARGTIRITVEVPIEHGDLIAKALDKALEAGTVDDAESAGESWHAQQADALVDIARNYLSGGNSERTSSTADHYQVVIHTDHSALTGGLTEGTGRSDLPVETVRRLSCDGSIIEMTDGPDGEPLNVGRKRRTVTTAIRRALWARDKGCAFPGCTHRRFVDAHHIEHWAKGGETRVDKMLLLCSSHHRLVHEGGYDIHQNHKGGWYFRRPDGRAVPGCGYRREDVTDDSVGWHPSAEGCANHSGIRGQISESCMT